MSVVFMPAIGAHLGWLQLQFVTSRFFLQTFPLKMGRTQGMPRHYFVRTRATYPALGAILTIGFLIVQVTLRATIAEFSRRLSFIPTPGTQPICPSLPCALFEELA